MLYTDDEIIEYEYDFADDVEWQDDNTESVISHNQNIFKEREIKCISK